MLLADQQRNLVFNFCRDYAQEAGFTVTNGQKGEKELQGTPAGSNKSNVVPPDPVIDYEDVTGEKMYISDEELAEMESVIYSISFGKQTHERGITYQAFSAAISSQMHIDLVLGFIQRRQKIRESKTNVVAYRLSKPSSEKHGNLQAAY